MYKTKSIQSHSTNQENFHKEEQTYWDQRFNKLDTSFLGSEHIHKDIDPTLKEKLLKEEIDKRKTLVSAPATLLLNTVNSSNEITSHAKSVQAKLMYDFLLSRTGSTSAEELVERLSKKNFLFNHLNTLLPFLISF